MKIGLFVLGIVIVLPICAVVGLFAFFAYVVPAEQWHGAHREIKLADQSSIIVDGKARGRSEHGFSQRVGYRPAGSSEVEWFGDVSDGVEPQIYQGEKLLVVIDPPAAQ